VLCALVSTILGALEPYSAGAETPAKAPAQAKSKSGSPGKKAAPTHAAKGQGLWGMSYSELVTFRALKKKIPALVRADNLSEAEVSARQMEKICRKYFGPENVDTYHASMALAEILVGRGKYAEADKLYDNNAKLIPRFAKDRFVLA